MLHAKAVPKLIGHLFCILITLKDAIETSFSMENIIFTIHVGLIGSLEFIGIQIVLKSSKYVILEKRFCICKKILNVIISLYIFFTKLELKLAEKYKITIIYEKNVEFLYLS